MSRSFTVPSEGETKGGGGHDGITHYAGAVELRGAPGRIQTMYATGKVVVVVVVMVVVVLVVVLVVLVVLVVVVVVLIMRTNPG